MRGHNNHGCGSGGGRPRVRAVIGTCNNNHTELTDKAMQDGEWVEAHPGSVVPGVTGAVLTAIGTSPCCAAVAAGGALKSAGSRPRDKVYDLFH
jgi:hypothetical protein